MPSGWIARGVRQRASQMNGHPGPPCMEDRTELGLQTCSIRLYTRRKLSLKVSSAAFWGSRGKKHQIGQHAASFLQWRLLGCLPNQPQETRGIEPRKKTVNPLDSRSPIGVEDKLRGNDIMLVALMGRVSFLAGSEGVKGTVPELRNRPQGKCQRRLAARFGTVPYGNPCQIAAFHVISFHSILTDTSKSGKVSKRIGGGRSRNPLPRRNQSCNSTGYSSWR